MGKPMSMNASNRASGVGEVDAGIGVDVSLVVMSSSHVVVCLFYNHVGPTL
jgi:hypothetical protein